MSHSDPILRCARAVVALLVLASGISLADRQIRTERVSFERGATGATVEGTIKGYETVDYALNARKGQYANVSMATRHGATYFNIIPPGETDVAIFVGSTSGNQYEGTLPASGDYTIRVYMMRSAARRNETADYRLEMIIDGGGGATPQGTGTAGADVPRFAAECGAGISVDTFATGEVRINGEAAKVVRRPDGQFSANSDGLWVDITPQAGVQPPRVTYTARDKTVGECRIVSFDAADPATGYHATAEIPCSIGGGVPTDSCPAGVKRRGEGAAIVTITRPDGRPRTIFFENGRATGYDQSEADSGKFSVSRQGDLNIIRIGPERYEIPDALAFGG
jgi:hypothetical protein